MAIPATTIVETLKVREWVLKNSKNCYLKDINSYLVVYFAPVNPLQKRILATDPHRQRRDVKPEAPKVQTVSRLLGKKLGLSGFLFVSLMLCVREDFAAVPH
jgi:hypothetical protein